MILFCNVFTSSYGKHDIIISGMSKMNKTKLRKIIVAILIAVIVVVYFGSPVDFIPDLISGFGWIDDFGILAIGLVGELINFLVGENVIRKKTGADGQTGTSESYEEPVGEYREID